MCQIHATSSGRLGYHLGFKSNITEKMELIFFPISTYFGEGINRKKRRKKKSSVSSYPGDSEDATGTPFCGSMGYHTKIEGSVLN